MAGRPSFRPRLPLRRAARGGLVQAGLHVTQEAPSATSVWLCLTHMAMDKGPWLALGDVETSWPMQGKPHRVGVDNGAEFHSQAFERGCAKHGIAIDWRPPGRPHFAGVVERVIGTLMSLVHDLPGTTFSNIGSAGATTVTRRPA